MKVLLINVFRANVSCLTSQHVFITQTCVHVRRQSHAYKDESQMIIIKVTLWFVLFNWLFLLKTNSRALLYVYWFRVFCLWALFSSSIYYRIDKTLFCARVEHHLCFTKTFIQNFICLHVHSRQLNKCSFLSNKLWVINHDSETLSLSHLGTSPLPGSPKENWTWVPIWGQLRGK